MIFGLGILGGLQAPFPFHFSLPRRYCNGNNNNNHWNPLSKLGPTNPSHLLSAAAVTLRHRFLHPPFSLLLCSSLKGTFNGGVGHIKHLNFFQRLDDIASAACTMCFCLFDGNSSGQEINKEGGSPQDTLKNNLLQRGRWTHVLLAVNVLLFVGQMATQGKLMLWGAKINSRIDEGQLWRLVTSAFLHANIGHLLVNCYSLHSIGPTVENLCGTQRFFTVYFASAVASSAMSYWLSEAPSVGASGAIFGLVGSVAIFTMRHRKLLGSGAQGLKHIAKVIVLNMIIGLSFSGIDNWGHLGGLLGGAAVSWVVGPAFTYESTTRDGRKVYVDRAPIYFLHGNKPF